MGDVLVPIWALFRGQDKLFHQVTVTILFWRTYVAIHLHKSRLYILEATAPEGTPPPGHFQQSLSILDENGDRIRYNLDADGVRTRVD